MPHFHCFRTLLCCVLLAASCVAAAQNDPPRVTRVYRADSRPPSVVFNTGFTGRGTMMDVLAHTLGGACEEATPARASGWVSTSRDRDEAHGFAIAHLEAREDEGPSTAMWLYEIRADPTYVVVRGVADQAIRAGDAEVDGYTPEHARVLRRLMLKTVMGTEQEVIVHHVHPGNIVSATALYFVNGDPVEEPAVQNAFYVHQDSRADWHVEDLRAFIPPASIRLDYDDDASSCSMSCDSSGSSASRGIAFDPGEAGFCKAVRKTQITLEKLLILLD